ncbi:MAG: molybdenum cofactor guanylyltransferase [Candidatus Omnitrophica bacterium]|nr:molybdenum cofactor guanylyltransferase [Candidatus Omnitrophota bacterium]
MKLSAVILAGGKNTRMNGEDKAFLSIEGEPIIERQLGVLGKIFDDILIVSNRPARYKQYRVRVVKDLVRARGPLGGIYTGLHYIKNNAAFFCACDMPFLHNETIRRQTAYFTKTRPECLVACCRGVQPLHGIYSKQMIGALRSAMGDNELSIKKCLQRVSKLSYINFHEQKYKYFLNLNTPQELGRANAES